MLAKLKPIYNIASIALIACAIASNALAYNEQDIQTLAATKQCIDCNFENYSDFWKDFSGVLDKSDVSGSNLRGIKLRGYLRNVNFSNTDLSSSKLQIQINNIVISGMMDNFELDFSKFVGSNFSEAIFLGSAYNVDFSSANFYKLNNKIDNDDYDYTKQSPMMVSAPLYIENSNFTGANFREANLFNVVFENSDFTDADFTDANLNGTDFVDCMISLEQIRKAKDICNLILPNGDTIIGRLQDDGQLKLCDGYSHNYPFLLPSKQYFTRPDVDSSLEIIYLDSVNNISQIYSSYCKF